MVFNVKCPLPSVQDPGSRLDWPTFAPTLSTISLNIAKFADPVQCQVNGINI